MHAVEVDEPGGGIGAIDGCREIRAGGGDAEDTAAGGLEPDAPMWRGTGLEDGGAAGFRSFDASVLACPASNAPG